MGDEGLPVGACLLYLHGRDGATVWNANRYKMQGLYLGRDHDAAFRAAAERHPEIVADRDQPDAAASPRAGGLARRSPDK